MDALSVCGISLYDAHSTESSPIHFSPSNFYQTHTTITSWIHSDTRSTLKKSTRHSNQQPYWCFPLFIQLTSHKQSIPYSSVPMQQAHLHQHATYRTCCIWKMTFQLSWLVVLGSFVHFCIVDLRLLHFDFVNPIVYHCSINNWLIIICLTHHRFLAPFGYHSWITKSSFTIFLEVRSMSPSSVVVPYLLYMKSNPRQNA